MVLPMSLNKLEAFTQLVLPRARYLDEAACAIFPALSLSCSLLFVRLATGSGVLRTCSQHFHSITMLTMEENRLLFARKIRVGMMM